MALDKENDHRRNQPVVENPNGATTTATTTTTAITRRWKTTRNCSRAFIIASLAMGYVFTYLYLPSNSEYYYYYSLFPSVKSPPTTPVSLYELNLPDIRRAASLISTVYQKKHPKDWCVDARLKLDQKKREPMGLCYLRLPHSAGATLKGINMRIASNFAKRHDVENCIRHDASHSVGIHYVRRHKKSYLWTFVRDPTDRAMSAIGSKLSKELLGPNNRDAFDARNFTNDTTSSLGVDDDLNKRFLASKVMPLLQNSSHIHEGVVSEGRGGFQLQFGMQRYIKANHHFDPLYPSEIQNQDYLLTNVRQFVHAYDFVGVVERFDESLVAMQLLLGLETSDMLYFAVNRKEQWHRSKLAHKQYGCRKPFDWETDLVADASVRNYLATSRHWYARNYGDYLLYQTAALSLDRTILDIGLDVFSVELKRFRALLKRAHEECTPINWCSPNGTNQYNESLRDCMDEGRIGCGYRCLDGLASS